MNEWTIYFDTNYIMIGLHKITQNSNNYPLSLIYIIKWSKTSEW